MFIGIRSYNYFEKRKEAQNITELEDYLVDRRISTSSGYYNISLRKGHNFTIRTIFYHKISEPAPDPLEGNIIFTWENGTLYNESFSEFLTFHAGSKRGDQSYHSVSFTYEHFHQGRNSTSIMIMVTSLNQGQWTVCVYEDFPTEFHRLIDVFIFEGIWVSMILNFMASIYFMIGCFKQIPKSNDSELKQSILGWYLFLILIIIGITENLFLLFGYLFLVLGSIVLYLIYVLVRMKKDV